MAPNPFQPRHSQPEGDSTATPSDDASSSLNPATAVRSKRLSPANSESGPFGSVSETPAPRVGSDPTDVTRDLPPGYLLPGSKFGGYEIGACIGEGGMARVYQAEHAGLRRQVALKVLTDGFARHPDARERFLREARMAAAIKHPNVVNVFDVGVHDELPYLVMELLDGQDLEKLLACKGALDESTIVDIMVPVVAGLIGVHDAGIVHRDLKPGNIFLAKGKYNDTEPKLLDFGISKSLGLDQLRLTANRGFMGTPFYASPEGLQTGEVTPLSDQYSLGVVMYECATGAPPYAASTFPELFKLITDGKFKPPAMVKPELSKRLARIIERAMSRDPAERFSDLREMGRELLILSGQRTRITWGLSFGELPGAEGVGRVSHAGAVASSNVPPAASAPPPKPRKRLAAAMIAITPFFLLGGGLFAWLSERQALDAKKHGSWEATTAAAAVGSAARIPNEQGVTARIPADPPTQLAPAANEDLKPSTEVMHLAAPPALEAHEVHPAPAHDVHQQEQTAVRRPVRAVAPATRPRAGRREDEPDWALPPIQGGESQTFPVGANSAPIFD